MKMKYTNMFDTSFHDEKLIDIRNENNDIIIKANDENKVLYIIRIKQPIMKIFVGINFEDMKGNDILTLSYRHYEDGEKSIYLETFNNSSVFSDEVEFYSKEIEIIKE